MDSLAEARARYEALAKRPEVRARMSHSEHKGRRVIPVLPSTFLHEVWDVTEIDEVVVIANVMNGTVEPGLYTRTRTRPDSTLSAFGGDAMTFGELVERTKRDGDGGPLPEALRDPEPR